MAQARGTAKRFEIPAPEEVCGSDAAPVRPLFKSSSAPRPETRGESEGGARPTAPPAASSYADYLLGRQGVSASEGGRSGPRGEAGGGRGSASRPPPPPRADRRACGPGEASGKTPKLNAIIASPRQRGNPILRFVRNVPWEFGDIVPDYVLGQTTCALFLSLRYHCLNQEYIHERLKSLGQAYALRVLLVQVDVRDPHHALKELAKICLLADCTLILAWSAEEAGRYLETYKSYENKPSDILKERVDQDFLSKVTDCLTAVKSVNKTDSVTLLSTFKSLSNMVEASREDLSLCPGLGPQKARRLHDVFHEPFLRSQKLTPGKADP